MRPYLNRALNLWINFTFFNEGATPGAVFELSGTILPVNGGKKVDIKWRSFLEDKNIAAPGEMVRYRIINLGGTSYHYNESCSRWGRDKVYKYADDGAN